MSFETSAPAAMDLQRYSLNGQTMGTRYSAVFFASAGIDEAAISAALFAAVDRIDRQMSTWKTDSDLSRLNALPEQQWMALPEELMTVLDNALRVGQQSRGAFDIGVGSLVNAWGFGPAGAQDLAPQLSAPDHDPLNCPHYPVHYPADSALELDLTHSRARKTKPVTLDLSGIAKGYGVDVLAHGLDGFGVTRYLVGIDGEMRAKGLKPDGKAWAVAIEKPVRHVREVMGVMALSDAATATSGDYRQWVEVQGQHYSHTMNPMNSRPARNRLASVTVMMPSCMLADAWATALLVLGEVDGLALAQKRGMYVLFVLRNSYGDTDEDSFEQISLVGGQRQP